MAAIAILKNIKCDNSGRYQAIKISNISNSTIFDMTNSMECLFFRFRTISKSKMAGIAILKKKEKKRFGMTNAMEGIFLVPS